MRFVNRVALVTGAASGIGRAVALRLAAEGAQVFAVDVNAEPLADTERLIGAHGEGACVTRVADLRDPGTRAAVVHECVERFGRLDVLGNIAGIARAEHFTDMTLAGYRTMMAINVDAPVFLAQAAIPYLLSADGTIVNIASNAGLMGMAYNVAYTMSKGAIVQLTRSLAMEYVKQPLRVNAIAPAGVVTGIMENFTIPPNIDPKLMAPYVGYRPPAQPEDIATLFAFLASDDARNIHGAIVSSDGGVTAG